MNDHSVCGIIFDKTRENILLVKRSDVPVWVLPGGGIEAGETPENAIVREMEEETGCKVKIQKKVAEYTPVCRLAKFTHFFECDITSGFPNISDETTDIKFFPLTKLPKKIPPPFRDWIQDATCQNKTVLQKKITSVTYFVFIKSLLTHPIFVFRFLLSRIGLHINSKQS